MMRRENINNIRQARSSAGNKTANGKPTQSDKKKKSTGTKESTDKVRGTKIKSGSVKKPETRRKKQERWDDKLSPEDRSLYELRTRRLAKSDEENQESSDQVTFIRLRLGRSEWYGLPYEHIEEILYAKGITSVPGTPEFIAGVINHNGEMLTILNLRAFFSTEHIEYGDDARIMVVKGSGLTVGFLVDEITGNDSYDPLLLAEPLPSKGVSNIRYVKGIHRGSIAIINPVALLSDQAIRVG